MNTCVVIAQIGSVRMKNSTTGGALDGHHNSITRPHSSRQPDNTSHDQTLKKQ